MGPRLICLTVSSAAVETRGNLFFPDGNFISFGCTPRVGLSGDSVILSSVLHNGDAHFHLHQQCVQHRRLHVLLKLFETRRCDRCAGISLMLGDVRCFHCCGTLLPLVGNCLVRLHTHLQIELLALAWRRPLHSLLAFWPLSLHHKSGRAYVPFLPVYHFLAAWSGFVCCDPAGLV